MLKIGEVTSKFDISHRTLRFWEEVGIIKSERSENGYRLYDEMNAKRIRQAIVLRKLDVPLVDIEKIFRSDSLAVTIEILRNQLGRVQRQTEAFRTVSLALEYLISLLNKQTNLDEMFLALDLPKNGQPFDFQQIFDNALQKEKMQMTPDDVLIRNEMRIVRLPKLVVAGCSSDKENPEDDCWNQIRPLIATFRLDQEPGFRNFGYGYNRSDGVYVYHVMVTVPEKMIVPEPFIKFTLPGGLFAALPSTLFNIGERWTELCSMVDESDHYVPVHEAGKADLCLEEVLDLEAFFRPGATPAERQLDLLLPITEVSGKTSAHDGLNLPTLKTIYIPDVLLCGELYPTKEPIRPYRLIIPWYKLAQSLYKVGPNLNDYLVKGSDTYAIIYGVSSTGNPSFLDPEKGKVNKVFASVEVKAPFSSFPDHLENKKLKSQKCLLVSQELDPSNGSPKKIDLKPLFMMAYQTIKKENIMIDEEKYLLREYRYDGRTVNRVELYFFIQ
ncbi:MAG: MerR family transcriptional regulator [Candidatus Pacebacteria bacterium]|nr:MerR family transcriptional regulator [Candidatus Paceibacterota bacterium]